MEEKDVFPSRRRTVYGLIHKILSICNEPTSRTKIYYKMEGNLQLVKKLVGEAINIGVLQELTDNANKRYLITEKGVEYICNWEKFLQFLKGEENVSSQSSSVT